jgi:signal transduction histidine kinase
LAALNFVSSKTSDKTVIPDSEQRTLVQGDVRVIDSSLQFVNELLRNMLDLHRTSRGHGIKLHLVPTDVMKDILQPVASILYMRGASVEILTECHPPNLYILADRMRLKQILLNLAFNATKFVERGFIRLRAHLHGGDPNDNAVMSSSSSVALYVEDSGPGIPQHKRSSLFTKFQESLDVLNQGTGIGLALCKKLSVLMGRYHRVLELVTSFMAKQYHAIGKTLFFNIISPFYFDLSRCIPVPGRII